MAIEVLMPQLGESVVEGTITKWLKNKGEQVEEYEPLLEINTDKVDSEIPSPASGVLLDILIPEGDTIQAGTVLALIEEEGEKPSEGNGGEPQAKAKTRSDTRHAPVGPPVKTAGPAGLPGDKQPSPGRDHELGFISPVVAKIASENQINLYEVTGTGQGGRITKKDVLAYLEKRPVAEPAPRVEPPAVPVTAPAQSAPLPSEPAPQAGEILPLNPVRRAIAEHMVFSKHTSPHVTTVMEADLSQVFAHRQANKEQFKRDGVNLTFTAYFVTAIIAALKALPIVNSSWSEEGIQIHRDINIGMATSMGASGLIVPVIKNADSFSLLGLARTINDLSNRARNRQLKPEEVKGGTFTITNHGTSGSLFATPIINQPQCAILGVGVIQKRVVVISDAAGNDSIAIRPMVYVSLTFDHRILDGAMGDSFLSRVVEYLQNWN
ncbi:MAG: dihydrolipoamide acetyltransferase family protein [Anaerolineales bacterium]|jgi:2-oxoglutarate dehydrogenase dihydrolipoamide succinyltransferase (E2 component)